MFKTKPSKGLAIENQIRQKLAVKKDILHADGSGFAICLFESYEFCSQPLISMIYTDKIRISNLNYYHPLMVECFYEYCLDQIINLPDEWKIRRREMYKTHDLLTDYIRPE